MTAEKSSTTVVRRRAKRWGEAEARALVDAWRRSGQSVTAFARERGVKPERLRRWVVRLESKEVIHNHKDDRMYANVKGIMPLGGTATKMDSPADYVRVPDRPQQNGGPANHQGRPWEADEEEDDPDDGLPF